MQQPHPIAGRSCDGCTLCCKVMRADELQKPSWQWCPHCVIGKGCGIYETRPGDCRVYLCEYLTNPGVSEAWYPKTSHMIIEVLDDGINAHVYVDPDHPEMWRTEPFYSDLKGSAREAVKRRCRLTVHVGKAQTIVFPDRDVAFGIVEADEEVMVVFPKSSESKLRAAAYKRKIGGPSLGPEHWR
jgi:hypothetical protein